MRTAKRDPAYVCSPLRIAAGYGRLVTSIEVFRETDSALGRGADNRSEAPRYAQDWPGPPSKIRSAARQSGRKRNWSIDDVATQRLVKGPRPTCAALMSPTHDLEVLLGERLIRSLIRADVARQLRLIGGGHDQASRVTTWYARTRRQTAPPARSGAG